MKRIKTLCILLLVVFFGNVYQGAILPFFDGVKYGISVAKYQIANNENTDDYVLMDVRPKEDTSLDKSEINLKTNNNVFIRTNNISVMSPSYSNKPFVWHVLQLLFLLFSLVAVVLGVWVPFLVVKIVRSLQRSEVFDRNNLKRINRIGIILLSIGILESLLQTFNVLSASMLIDLAHYKFSYSKVIDFNSIIMGVVVLIMNEVLRIGIDMKEEQDLTV